MLIAAIAIVVTAVCSMFLFYQILEEQIFDDLKASAHVVSVISPNELSKDITYSLENDGLRITCVDKIIQFFNDQLVVFRSLIGTCLYIVQITLDRIQTFKEQVDHITVNFNFITSDFLKNIFHIMGQSLHALKSHGTCHTL